MKRKCLAVVIFLLFVGTCIIPSVPGNLLNDDTTPPITTITLNGTMGENGWYVSNINVTLNATDDMSGVNRTNYRIDDGEWRKYVDGFIIKWDGFHFIDYYSIDNAGNVEDVKTASFKLDQTGPDVWFAIAKIRFGKWFIYANVSDSTSGMEKVEFYVEDVFQGTVFELPYLWICNDSMRFSLVIAYDKAGNYNIPQIPDPYPILHTRMAGIISNVNITEKSVSFHAILVFTYHGILRDEQVTYPNSYVGYIGKFFINAVFFSTIIAIE